MQRKARAPRNTIIRNNDVKYTPIERKLSRYSHDPNRYYNGGRDEEAFLNAIGTVKAVRLG